MLRHCFPAVFVVLFLSCLSEPDCIITSTNLVNIAFTKDSVSDSARFVKFDSIVVSGTDSLFHVGDSVSKVVVPVNPDNFQTTFYFYYNDSIADSIRVSYTRATRVISPACGAYNYFQDLEVLVNTFPSIKVLDHQLSTSNAPNLRVGL